MLSVPVGVPVADPVGVTLDEEDADAVAVEYEVGERLSRGEEDPLQLGSGV